MMSELTMLTRYALMGLTGYLVAKGTIPEDVSQGIIEVGVIILPALIGYFWKKIEDYMKEE